MNCEDSEDDEQDKETVVINNWEIPTHQNSILCLGKSSIFLLYIRNTKHFLFLFICLKNWYVGCCCLVIICFGYPGGFIRFVNVNVIRKYQQQETHRFVAEWASHITDRDHQRANLVTELIVDFTKYSVKNCVDH